MQPICTLDKNRVDGCIWNSFYPRCASLWVWSCRVLLDLWCSGYLGCHVRKKGKSTATISDLFHTVCGVARKPEQLLSPTLLSSKEFHSSHLQGTRDFKLYIATKLLVRSYTLSLNKSLHSGNKYAYETCDKRSLTPQVIHCETSCRLRREMLIITIYLSLFDNTAKWPHSMGHYIWKRKDSTHSSTAASRGIRGLSTATRWAI